MFSILGLMLIQAAAVRPLPTAMRTLSEQELRSRIVGKQIETTDVPPPGRDYVTTERFAEDGSYWHTFHGREDLGTYRFVGEMICVRLNNRERCRTGLTDTNNDLWLLTKGADRTRLGRYVITK